MAEGKEYERYSEIIFGVLERNDQMEGMLQELSATFDLPGDRDRSLWKDRI